MHFDYHELLLKGNIIANPSVGYHSDNACVVGDNSASAFNTTIIINGSYNNTYDDNIVAVRSVNDEAATTSVPGIAHTARDNSVDSSNDGACATNDTDDDDSSVHANTDVCDPFIDPAESNIGTEDAELTITYIGSIAADDNIYRPQPHRDPSVDEAARPPLTNDSVRDAVRMWNANRSKAEAKYGHISAWNTSWVTDMSGLFRSLNRFNDCIDHWDVGNVTDMSGMFSGAKLFNQKLNSWRVENVVTMSAMFSHARSFNQSLDEWKPISVTNFKNMFSGAVAFNQPIDSWNVQNAHDMSEMFLLAETFNQPLSSWNVRSVTTMSHMFGGAVSFNQPLSSWNVRSVTTMSRMFAGAVSFNQPLSSWEVGSVTSMANMFSGAVSFNQTLGMWNVSRVRDMRGMFTRADAFDQDLDDWVYHKDVAKY
jgi:surface protein